MNAPADHEGSLGAPPPFSNTGGLSSTAARGAAIAPSPGPGGPTAVSLPLRNIWLTALLLQPSAGGG